MRMGKKYRKKLPVRPPKKIPSIFPCPNCGKKAVKVFYDRGEGEAVVSCGNCKIYVKIKVSPIFSAVDIYGRFVDLFYEGKVETGSGTVENAQNRQS